MHFSEFRFKLILVVQFSTTEQSKIDVAEIYIRERKFKY